MTHLAFALGALGGQFDDNSWRLAFFPDLKVFAIVLGHAPDDEGIRRTVQQKRVTYDLERLMPGATKLGTADFATAIIDNMNVPVAR